jgi:hypothetical protein
MIALARHGKDPRLVQPSIIPEFQIGDRVKDSDGFTGVITDLKPNHLTIQGSNNRKCFNLLLHKQPLHKLISHISTSSAELEPSQKPVAVQKKSRRSPTAISTKAPSKSTATTSQSLASIPTSENITHLKESISIREDSPVLELPTLETSKDSITQSPPCGLSSLDASMKDDPDLLSLRTPPQLSVTDYEQYLEDCEWLDIVGTIHKSYKLLSLEAPKREKDCLSLPTLTTGQGSRRNAGQTRLEKALKDKGFRQDTQALSAEGMSVLFGFPPNWAKSICSNPKESPTGTTLDGYSGEQLISTVPPSQLNESSISIAALTKVRINKTSIDVPKDIAPIFKMEHTTGINIVNPNLLDLIKSLSSDRLKFALELSEKYGGCQKKRELLVRHLKLRDSWEKYKFYSQEFPCGSEVEIVSHPKSTNVWVGSKGIVQAYKSESEAATISYRIAVKIYSEKVNDYVNPYFEDFELRKIGNISANNIDARLQFLLEQRDRLINSGASPQGVWLSVGQVYKKDFRQVVWKSAKEHEWLGGNKSRYIGKENSDEHVSAIAQHKAGQELRKVEREIKSIQSKKS